MYKGHVVPSQCTLLQKFPSLINTVKVHIIVSLN